MQLFYTNKTISISTNCGINESQNRKNSASGTFQRNFIKLNQTRKKTFQNREKIVNQQKSKHPTNAPRQGGKHPTTAPRQGGKHPTTAPRQEKEEASKEKQ